jgi:hypothetical protein
MLVSTEDGELAAVSKGASKGDYIVTLRGTNGPAGACKVTERNGRINVFFPCDGCSDLCDRVCVHSLIAEARMPGSFARAAPVVGSSEPLPDPGQHADYDSGTGAAVTACSSDEEESSEELCMLACPACELLSECHRHSDDRICPCGFCIICCEDLCWFYGTSAIHWHQDSSLCECSWLSDEDEEEPAPAAAAGEGTGNDEDEEEPALAAAAGEGTGNDKDCQFRDLVDEYNRLKAEAGDEQLSDETRSHRAMASHGAAHCAMSFIPRASHPSDERGREVSGIQLGDAVTAFLDEGGEMSIDAHGGCSLHGCSLLQLRRYNELQLQLQLQHQQGLSRPSEPGRWQPTHMRCGAFFVPVCEHCYHEDCEGECLEVDPADSEAWAQMRRHQRRHGW